MPQAAAADYASQLRRIADQLPPDLVHLAPALEKMADAFERAINNTNNNAAGVIALVELGLTGRVDEIAQQLAELKQFFEQHDQIERDERADLTSQIGELQQSIGQILGLLRDEAQRGVAGGPADPPLEATDGG